jgi:hypothetical protein
MTENYFIDTDKFSIDKFRNILLTKEILPGRIILKENLDERFDLLKTKKIKTLSDLLETLKTKQKVDKFSNDTGLSVEYLTILRREANSYLSVPVKLIDLPFVETDIINKLELQGIKDSKQLFENAAKLKDRQKLSENHNLPFDELSELVCLCDLVRITGVGPVFARIIFDSGICTVKDFLSYDAIELLERLTKTNSEKGLTKSKFTLKDIEYCIELGTDLPFVVEI